MLLEIIKLAIEEINKLNGEYRYKVIEGNEVDFPRIMVKGTPEEVMSDIDQVQSVTTTNNTIMLHEDGAITIISPSNYTFHKTYC